MRNAYGQIIMSEEFHYLLIHGLFISTFSLEKMQLASHLLIRGMASCFSAFQLILIHKTEVRLSPNMKIFIDFFKSSYFSAGEAGCITIENIFILSL
jgi:hypothetical protein